MKKVSVIIPVYNCENYISKSVESVINQDISEVEIILVDDGSTDNSLKVCESLSSKYRNIKVISQENKGPGAARNAGLKVATGDYVTFLDGDDLLPKNIFNKVYSILKDSNSDIFIGNILCFNDVRTWYLPYMKDVFLPKGIIKSGKFLEMQEVNESASVCNKWFKLNLIRRNNIRFNETIRVGEDLLFTQEAFLRSEKIVTKNIDIYKYRLINKDSLIKKSNVDFFNNLVELQSKLVDLYKSTNISSDYILLRQLVFFIDSIFLKIRYIPEELINNIIDLGIEIFKISPNINLHEGKFRSKERYLLATLLKENNKKNVFKLITDYILSEKSKLLVKEEDRYYSYLYKDFYQYKDLLLQEPVIESKVENAYIDEKNILTLRGYAFIRGIDFSDSSKIKRQLVLEGKNNRIINDIKNDYRTDLTYLFRGDLVNYHWGGYEPIKINLSDLIDDEYKVFLRVIVNEQVFEVPFEFRLAEIKNKLKERYIDNKGVFFKFNEGKYMCINVITLNKKTYIKSRIRRIRKDIKFDIGLIKGKKYRTFIILYLYKVFGWYFKRKNIWLMGERRDTAQDNTYHLFKYIKENKKGVNAKYIITKNAKDLQNIKLYGNIVWFNSILHNLYLLSCKFTINSYAEKPNMYTCEYIDIIKYYPEFAKNKKIFLQHGVIGVSRVNHVLHKNRVNYDLFVVSSEFEKNHIVKEFGYDENEVIVTGLPRWDNLNNKASKNKILLMPTWRSWIKSEEELIESEYFNTYLKLLNNKQLHKILEDNNYELTFYPHYQMQKLLSKINIKFHPNIKMVKQGEKKVQDLINENYILITDYSTVAFDFAYCNKKIIFYQFDYDKFYSIHYNKGVIEFDKELFGVITLDEESLIQILNNKDDINFNNKRVEKYIKNFLKSHCTEVFKEIEKESKKKF